MIPCRSLQHTEEKEEKDEDVKWYHCVSSDKVLRRTSLPAVSSIIQQTRSFEPTAKLKMVFGNHPTGGVLEVDRPPPRFNISAGTREYR